MKDAEIVACVAGKTAWMPHYRNLQLPYKQLIRCSPLASFLFLIDVRVQVHAWFASDESFSNACEKLFHHNIA